MNLYNLLSYCFNLWVYSKTSNSSVLKLHLKSGEKKTDFQLDNSEFKIERVLMTKTF